MTYRALVVAGIAGCTAAARPTADATVGSGSFAINGTAQNIQAVWATIGYEFIGNGNDSVGSFQLAFAATGAGVMCSETSALAVVEQISILTTQVFSPTSGGSPSLAPGAIPVVTAGSISVSVPPAHPVAYIERVHPEPSAGTVTITSADATTLQGTFDATGASISGSISVTGSFAATICPAE